MKNPSYFIPQHQETTWVLYRRLWQDHIRHYRHWMVGALILMALVAGSTAAIAKLIQPILDKVFIERDPTALWTIGSLVLLTFMIRGFATFGQNMVMSAFGNRIVTDIQKRLFAHVIYLDLGFFYNNSTGVLLSRFSNDITMLRSVVSNTLTGFGKDSMTLIFLVALMFHQDPFLAFITLFVFPIGAYPIIVLGKKLRKLVDKTQGVMERTTTVLEQVFSGIRHVKAYGMEEEENTRLRRILDEFYRLTQRAQRNRSILYPIVETLGGLTVVTVIVYGGLQVIEGT
ncbi:MAG: ABC transporter transmembrane domain-containing protein, partial [Dongiaceae bacterium]